MRHVVVTVKFPYSQERVETFEGSERVVRAALLVRFPFVRSPWVEIDNLEDVVGHLDRLQVLEVDLVES